MPQTEKVWMLHLTGQGDTYAILVDQETYEWVTSPNMGRSPGSTASEWVDQTTPANILAKLGKMPALTIGSWQNDRAMEIASSSQWKVFWTLSEAMNAVSQGGQKVVSVYEGDIY